MNSLLRSTFVLLILNIFFTNSLFAAITNLSSPLDTTTQNNTPTGIYFSNDGSKVFVLGSRGAGDNRDSIAQYSLSTAYDVSTASGSIETLIVDGGIGSVIGFTANDPFGLTFNDNGSKVYIADGGDHRIYEITLGSNFDLTSSATHTGTLATNVTNGSGTPCGLTFNNDGSKLFLAGFAQQRIIYWPLSTNYDIDTEGTLGFFDLTPYKSGSNFKPRDVDFNSDGTRMYVVDRLDRVVVFKLDNAFDLSSGVTELGSIDTNSFDPQTFSSEFNSDGSKFYTIGYGSSVGDNQGDDIIEFSVSPAYDIIPTLSSSTPADNATGVSVTANIVLNFSENVDAESGNITIKKTSDDSTIETIDVTGAKVSGSGGTQITVNPSTTLDGETEYYVLIDATAFDDAQGGSYIGISSTTALSFTTADVANPTLTSSTPSDNATGIAINSNIILNFNETVTVSNGNITIKKSSDDSTVEQIDITSGQVSGSNSTQLTVNPSSDLDEGTEFYIQIDSTAVVDTSSNAYDGINDTTTLSFTTSDDTNPTLSSSSPADNASGVEVDVNIVLNFSESVDAESGNITIKKTSDDTTVETIDVTGGQVSGSGSSQITVNPSSDLDNGVEYYLLIDATAFDDALGNSYAGISSKTALSFTSVSSNSNPFLNKQVVALTEAQTQASKDLVQHITTPIFNRLYWLKEHQKGNNLLAQKLKVNFSNSTLNKLSNALKVSNEFNENSNNTSDELSKWLFWSEGSVSVGRVGDTSLSSSKEIRSDGVTLGMDKLLNNDLTIGYAFRFNKDDIDVGETGTTLDTNAKSFSIYGNYPNDLNKYFETIIGFNLLNLESIRVDGSNKLTGSRNGRQVYGSIKYVGILGGENIYFSPNIKIDFSDTSMDEYSEIGTSALTFQKQNVQTTNIYSGFIVSNTIDFENFTIRPNGGLEIGLDISPSSEVKLNYVSDPNTVFIKSIEHKNEKLLNTNLGFDLTSNNGFSIILLYKRNQNTNGHSDTLSLGVGYLPKDNAGYEANIKNGLANFKFNKKFDYFNVNLNSEYDMVSIDPNYGINFEISSEF